MKNAKVFAALGVAGALGIACVPMASYARTYNRTVNVTVIVDSIASVTWNVSAAATQVVSPGTAASFGEHYVRVFNNNNDSGFDLKVKGEALTSDSDSISALASKGAIATSASSVSTSAWGVQATTESTAPAVTDTNWIGPSDTYQTLMSGIGGDSTAHIYYAAAASSSQPSGSYYATITLLLDPSA